MATFRQFLEGAADEAGRRPKDHNADDGRVLLDIKARSALEAIDRYCSDSMWMVKQNAPIWRGERNIPHSQKIAELGFGAVDSLATTRASENSTNHYTLILDNVPSRASMPKRSKSLICSTSNNHASYYATRMGVRAHCYALIPFNDAVIGVCNRIDIWDTPVTIWGEEHLIEEWNIKFEEGLGIAGRRWEEFEAFDRRLKAHDVGAKDMFRRAFPEAGPNATQTFIEDIDRAYSPKALGQTSEQPRGFRFDDETRSELWISGKVLMIVSTVWDDLIWDNERTRR